MARRPRTSGRSDYPRPVRNPLIIGLSGEQPAAESNVPSQNYWQSYTLPAQTPTAQTSSLGLPHHAGPSQRNDLVQLGRNYAPPAQTSPSSLSHHTGHAGPSQRDDLVQLGQNSYNDLIWSGVVGNPAANNLVATFLPVYPTVQQAQRFGSRETNVILGSETSAPRRPQQLNTRRSRLPPTPRPPAPPIPQPAPIQGPAGNPPVTGTAAPFHAPPNPNYIPSSHAQEEPRTGFTHVAATEQPISSTVAQTELTQEQTKAVLKKGRSEIVRIMITTTAVPHHLERQDMYADAISTSIQAVAGVATANPPDNYVRTLSLAMRDVRYHFKTHCVHNVQHVYSLYLEDGGDGYVDPDLEFEHCARRVSKLSNGDFDFLRDDPSHPYFTSSYFKHFILDMLTFAPYSFASFVDEHNMDNFFALGGTAISAALDDYIEGYLAPQDLNADVWRRYYIPIIGLIGRMREDEVVGNWLQEYQRNLLDRARARLHRRARPTHTTRARVLDTGP